MKESEDNFSVFIPIDIEKSTDNTADKYQNMRIKGIASTIHSGRDSDGEILETSGMDVTELINSGFLNYHHLQSTTPSAIIGEPTKAEVKDGNLYIEGRLYPDSQKAREVYDLGEVLEKNSENRRLGFSIEGKATLRNPKDKKHILKSRILHCAITPMPKCKGTKMEIMKGWTNEIDFEILKAETDNQGNTIEYLIDTTDSNGIRRTVDKNLHIKVWDDKLEKGGIGSGKHKYVIGSKVKVKLSNPVNPSKIKEHEVTVNQHDVSESGELMYGGKNEKGKQKWFTEKNVIHKAMIAGNVTGRDTTNQSLTVEPLKQEHVAGTKVKKKKKGDDDEDEVKELSKGEALILLSEQGYDAQSAMHIWELANEVKNLYSKV